MTCKDGKMTMPELSYSPPSIQDAFERLMLSLGKGLEAVNGLEELVDAVEEECGREVADALDNLFDTIMANNPNS